MVGDDIQSFAFFDEQHIIVALLTVFHNDEASNNIHAEPILAVMNFKDETNERRAIDDVGHMVIFRYPALNTDAIPFRFDIRSDPAPAWVPNSNLQVPFFTAQYNRLYAISLWLRVKHQQHCIMLFAPWATFLKCIQGNDTPPKPTVDWPAWGPSGTRILLPRIPPSDVWVCYVNGSRYVALHKHKKGFVAEVYDFNRRGLLRSMNQDCDAASSDSYMTNASTFEDGAIFEGIVETSLPYRIQSLPLGVKSISRIAVIFSEDNLIIVDVRVFSLFL
jgi:hypothetical protein